MKLDEYQALAKRTLDPEQTVEELGNMTILGLIGETGELAELIKKEQFHGKPADREKVVLEAGDVLWYTAAEFTGSGYPMSAIDKQDFAELDTLVADKPLPDRDCIFGIFSTLMEADGAAAANRMCMLARLLQNHGATLNEAAEKNIAKLEARYPGGFKSRPAFEAQARQSKEDYVVNGPIATTTPSGNE